MTELHVLNIERIEQNTEELPFTYKPDVPKLKLYGQILISESEEEEEGILFLTQKQLNQIIGGKGIELITEEDKWYIKHPLTKDQTYKIGFVELDTAFLGTAGEKKCFELIEVK